MTPPAAAKPALLLWEHQLKREHGHLLRRMEELETQYRGDHVRVKAVESTMEAAKSTELKVKELDRLVDAIIEDEKNQTQYFDRVVGENQAKHEKTLETWRKTHKKVSALDAQYKSIQTDVTHNSSALDLMTKSVGAVRAAMEQVQRTANTVNESVPNNIMQRLEALDSRQSEGFRMMQDKTRQMQDKLARLERTNSELHSEVSRLKAAVATGVQALRRPTSKTEELITLSSGRMSNLLFMRNS
ncbi:hypothetical protein K505DRAFT_371195 [Melanomma pulvis-pyrius CBS 109.77]|uniref:Uncharacterized protein n=1 Tax=Melanomma pulvis-pyrius CBS 109.77 TaxID=1314802 RepID=A0A6A6XSU3_9PLEO|nr:hypothetical protein K505DRAFT_371195 [Melanomma pulvis-pyrius CBS 109.77]